MSLRNLISTLTLVVLLGLARSAPTAEEAMMFFSFDPPAGWSLNYEASMAFLGPPEGDAAVMILEMQFDNGDLPLMARNRAGKNPLRLLNGGALGYIFEDSCGGRAWGMMTEDEQFCEISLPRRYEGLARLLAGFKADPEIPGAAAIIRAANSPEVLSWLNYATERFAPPVPPDEPDEGAPWPETKPFRGYGLTADLPEGWTVARRDDTVVFTSGDGTVSCSVSRFRMEENEWADYDEQEDLNAFAKDRARKLGGVNIRAVEGDIEFHLPDGRTGLMSRYGHTCLLLLVAGEGNALTALLPSISPDNGT